MHRHRNKFLLVAQMLKPEQPFSAAMVASEPSELRTVDYLKPDFQFLQAALGAACKN
jgi:hypothetical protein